ncbi:hypothetical protein EDB87DRAFT_18799 [Lactarius vividus]|nr:hypothetical protein EDB87DRAFT_18799 [Lactarius vividus]
MEISSPPVYALGLSLSPQTRPQVYQTSHAARSIHTCAHFYSVDTWVLPALTALCERPPPLSLDEAQQMMMEDVILVATVREVIRGGALRVDAADIRRHVEVAQAGKLNRPLGNDVYWDKLKSRGTGQELDSMMTSGIDPNLEAGVAKTKGAASPLGQQQRPMNNEGGTYEGSVEHSVSLI